MNTLYSFGGELYRFENETVLAWEVFLVFVGIAALFGCVIAYREVRDRKKIRLGHTLWPRVRWVVFLPALVSVLLLLLAVPSRMSEDVLEEEFDGGRVLIYLDVSLSQQAGAWGDISDALGEELIVRGEMPTRLGLCKEALRETLRGVKGIRVSVISFTEAMRFNFLEWKKYVAGTKSAEEFEAFLRGLRPTYGFGTNIRRPIHEANITFIQDKLREDMPDMAILCSDGETNIGRQTFPLLEQVRKFSHNDKKHILILVWGAGGHTGTDVRIPEYSPDGRITGVARHPVKGHELRTTLFPDILQEIANESGGEYLHLSDLAAAREMFRKAVRASIERGEITITSAERLTDELGILALVLLFFLSNGFSLLKAPFIRRKKFRSDVS